MIKCEESDTIANATNIANMRTLWITNILENLEKIGIFHEMEMAICV